LERQYTAGNSNVANNLVGVIGSAVQNTWYTIKTWNTYDLSVFFLMVGMEDNVGDGSDRAAIFVNGTAAGQYGGGFTVAQLSGSTGIECTRSGNSIQIRQTGDSNPTDIYWKIITLGPY
jgi:hypothetical protein